MPSSYPFHSVEAHSAPTAGASLSPAGYTHDEVKLYQLQCPVGMIADASITGLESVDAIENWVRTQQHCSEPNLLLLLVKHDTGHGTEPIEAWINEHIPVAFRSKISLASSQPLENWANLLKSCGIGRFFNLTEANCLQWIHTWQLFWHNQQGQSAFRFETAINFENPTRTPIHCHSDIHQYREQLKTLLYPHPQLPNMSTAVIEAVYNACYHGPIHGRYKKGQPFTVSDDRDVVQVTTATTQQLGESLHLVSIADQWGRLTHAPILKGIQRHMAGEGLLDESGRGHFLMTMLTNQWAVAISPNQRTEYILFKAVAEADNMDTPAPHLLVFEA